MYTHTHMYRRSSFVTPHIQRRQVTSHFFFGLVLVQQHHCLY